MAKYKRMTQREKNERKKIRAELRAEGIMPAVKKRLNRESFQEEALKEFDEFSKASGIGSLPAKNRNMHIALLSVAHNQTQRNISPEQIGACKVMKIAAALDKYETKLRQSEDAFDYDKMIEEVVMPILKL